MEKNLNKNKDKTRLPPGQHSTNKFPVLQKGNIAHIDRENYYFFINLSLNLCIL